jgi:hypothetical protein
MARTGRPKKSEDVACVCEVCGKKYTVPSWRDDGRKYCSRECFVRSRAGLPSKRKILNPDVNHCLACGKPFEVGGEGRPKHTQRYCSTACSRTVHYIHGRQPKELSATDAAYIAGLMDGEGCIMLLWRKGIKTRVNVSNTHRPVLEWLVETTGIGGIVRQTRSSSKHSPSWYWQVNGDASESIVRQISPYLHIKSQQAALLLDTQERLRNPALKADMVWQEEYLARMHDLNRRGPSGYKAMYSEEQYG